MPLYAQAAQPVMGGYNAPAQPVMGGYNAPPAAPAAGAGAPSPSGTYYAPPSGSDQYAENYSDAQNAYNRALARFNQQRTGLLQQYGYKGTIDPASGMVTGLGVDAGDSHGALQQLLHTQALEDQNADYAAEDRGLVGGLAHQATSELAYEHHGQSADLANQLLSSLSDLNGQQMDAKDTLDQALWQLQHGAVTDAIDAGSYNPADVTGTTVSAPLPGPAAAKAKIVGTPAQIAAASMAAYKKAGGKSTPTAALAARSAGMNAAYGLATKAAAKTASPARYYTTKAEATKAAGGRTIKFTSGKGYYVA